MPSVVLLCCTACVYVGKLDIISTKASKFSIPPYYKCLCIRLVKTCASVLSLMFEGQCCYCCKLKRKKGTARNVTKTMLLFLNLTAKLLFHRFVSRLFICINLFRFTRGRLNCHVFKISLPLSKKTYQNDCIGSKSSEKKLQTPQCLEILSFAITLFW